MEPRILPKESNKHFSDQEIVDLKIRQGDASRNEVLLLLARLELSERAIIGIESHGTSDNCVPCQHHLEAWRKSKGE